MRTTLNPDLESDPSDEALMSAAREAGVKRYNPSFFRDLTAIAGGGVTIPTSQLREDIESSFQDDTSVSLEARVKYFQRVQDFLNSLDFSPYEGAPLHKAAEVLRVLQSMNGGSSSGGDPLPIFTNNSGEQVNAQMRQMFVDVEALTDFEKDIASIDDLSPAAAAARLEDSSWKKIFELSRKLEGLARIQLRRCKAFEVDPAGQKRRVRQMRSASELHKAVPQVWALRALAPTNFLYKLATNQLLVSERGEMLTKKQVVYILMDGSGSMSNAQVKTAAVALHVVEAAYRGDAEVYLSVFDTHLRPPTLATDKESAKALMRQVKDHGFSGGGTDISTCIRHAHEVMSARIKDGEALHRPEIVVLTDGDPTGYVPSSAVPEAVVHGFCTVRNDSIKRTVTETGGVYVEL